MTLTFEQEPSGVDPSSLEVRLFGKDTKTGDYVECRVTHKTLMDRCGATGQKPDELLRAFKDHRAKIEDAARRKYGTGQIERLSDRIVVRVGASDL